MTHEVATQSREIKAAPSAPHKHAPDLETVFASELLLGRRRAGRPGGWRRLLSSSNCRFEAHGLIRYARPHTPAALFVSGIFALALAGAAVRQSTAPPCAIERAL